MNPAQEDRIKPLFAEAVELAGAERRKLLDEIGATDPALRAELESLLIHHDRTDVILDRTPIVMSGPRGASAGAGLSDDAEELHLPATLGSYTLRRVIGAGGMGIVYEAEQASPNRRVAVKLIRPEALSPSMLRRFEDEAEALGMLEHPGIARVYEAGRAELGGYPRAFIAMELVEGPRLTEHAARGSLSAASRMALLAEVCDAIQYAHMRGVIHRDLKPANILVGADGRPRVLDFGVARLARADSPDGTVCTVAGQIVGTLAYMSPEQATGRVSEIDSRTDVYSLGAILFELLCGRPPIDVSGLSIQSALAAIQTKDVRPPKEIRRDIGRDAEAILLRALERRPSRRYQHASDLADDLRRALRRETITARAPTFTYQFSRFCARNRELVAAAALTLAVLLASVAAVSVALVRERQSRVLAQQLAQDAEKARDQAVANADRATRNMQRLEAVSGFLHTLLGSIQPEIARGKDTALLREILDRSERTLTALEHQPDALADAHALLSRVYRGIGDFAMSERHGVRALDLYLEIRGEEDTATATAMHNLGALYRGSLRRPDKAEPLLRRSVELFRLLAGPDDLECRNAQSSLALLYLDTGRYADAEPVLRELREFQERLAGPDDPNTLRMMHNHAGALMMLGRLAEAERLLRTTYEARVETLEPDHPDTVSSAISLATAMRSLDRSQEALPLMEQSVQLRRKVMGEGHQFTILARCGLIGTLWEVGRLEDAHAEAIQTAAIARSSLGERHPEALQARLLAVETGVRLGNCGEAAITELDAIIEAHTSGGARDSYWPARVQVTRAITLACLGRDAEAAPLFESAYTGLAAKLHPTHRTVRFAAEQAAEFHARRGDETEAEAWRARAVLPPETEP